MAAVKTLLTASFLIASLAGCAQADDSATPAAPDANGSSAPTSAPAEPSASAEPSAAAKPSFEVQGPMGANPIDPAQTVVNVVERLNKGGFPCSVADSAKRFGDSGQPISTIYSASALQCVVGENEYTVSSYVSEEAREEGEAFLSSGGDKFLVSGDFFIVHGFEKAGIQRAAEALQKTS